MIGNLSVYYRAAVMRSRYAFVLCSSYAKIPLLYALPSELDLRFLMSAMNAENLNELLNGASGKQPLCDYPWHDCAEKMMQWAKNKSAAHRAFIFDLMMSLAYIDTIPSIQKNMKKYDHLTGQYNTHLGFTNICMPLLIEKNQWSYHKAAKPQSGAIGKLTSEIMLKCLAVYFDDLTHVQSIGGTGLIDAVILHKDGRIILAEIKAAPLTTFPFLFKIHENVKDVTYLSQSQVGCCESALYLHTANILPLGKPNDLLWPFSAVEKFITNTKNEEVVAQYVENWIAIKIAYQKKDKESPLYYAANASGQAPKIARENFDWPAKESVSDSKTSAGLDRTDDIKKGVYQSFKIGVEIARNFPEKNIKTALISNLPAYRHGADYVEPFFDIFWAFESDFSRIDDLLLPHILTIDHKKLRRPFDYIITLQDAYLRGDDL